MVGPHDLATVTDRHRVVRRRGRFPWAGVCLPIGEAHHQSTRATRCSHPLDRLTTAGHEAGLVDEIFEGVPGDRHLRIEGQIAVGHPVQGG